MSKIQFTIRIDEILHEKLKVISEQEIRSVNNQFEYFIAKSIAEFEKQNGPIILPNDVTDSK